MGKKAEKWKAKFKLTKELLNEAQASAHAAELELLGLQVSKAEELEVAACQELQAQIDKLKEGLDREREHSKILQADYDSLELDYDRFREESENDRDELEEMRDAEAERLEGRVTQLEDQLTALTDHLGDIRVTRATLDVPQLSPDERVHLVEEDWDHLDALRRQALPVLAGREGEEDSTEEWT